MVDSVRLFYEKGATKRKKNYKSCTTHGLAALAVQRPRIGPKRCLPRYGGLSLAVLYVVSWYMCGGVFSVGSSYPLMVAENQKEMHQEFSGAHYCPNLSMVAEQREPTPTGVALFRPDPFMVAELDFAASDMSHLMRSTVQLRQLVHRVADINNKFNFEVVSHVNFTRWLRLLFRRCKPVHILDVFC